MYLKFVVPFTFLPYKNYIEHKYVQEIVVQYVQKQIKTKINTKPKSLKVFRLKAAILGLKFVNLMRFNCSLLSKTCLNVYRPTSPILSLPGTSCKLLSGAQAVPRSPPMTPW